MKVKTKISKITSRIKSVFLLVKDNYLYRWFPRLEQFIKFRQGKTIKSWSPSKKRYFYDYPIVNEDDIVTVKAVFYNGRYRAIEHRHSYKDKTIYEIKDGCKPVYVAFKYADAIFFDKQMSIAESSLDRMKEILDDK